MCVRVCVCVCACVRVHVFSVHVQSCHIISVLVRQECSMTLEVWGHVWASLSRFNGAVGVGD